MQKGHLSKFKFCVHKVIRVLLIADIAEIVEQKQVDGILSYYVHYVDRKHNLHAQAIDTQ